MENNFKENGFVVLKNVLSNNLKKELYENWNECKNINDTSTRFFNKLTPFFESLYKNQEILDNVSKFIGEDIAVYFYRLMSKSKSWSGEVPPHQEAPYFHGGHEKIMCFFPLERMNRENGGLYVIPGSHKFGFLGRVNDHEINIDKFPNHNKYFIDAELGDILIQDYLLWHGSDAAIRVSDRPLFHILYQPSSDGSHYGNEPILASGNWKTNNFLPFKFAVMEKDVSSQKKNNNINKVNLSNSPLPRISDLEFDLDLNKFFKDNGHCYTISLEENINFKKFKIEAIDVFENNLRLFDETPIHNEIRSIGKGKYCLWGEKLYLSTLDNKDPKSGDKKFTVKAYLSHIG